VQGERRGLDLEMAIPLKTMKLDKADGAHLVGNLVRTDFCGGIYFAASWAALDVLAGLPGDRAGPRGDAFHSSGSAMSRRAS